jgi:hypothetical protein
MSPVQLNTLDDLDQLPAALSPHQAEEALQATLHLAGWRGDLNKHDLARSLIALLKVTQPSPSALSIEIRRALLGWAAGSVDPGDLDFMELWRQLLTYLELDQGALQLIESTRPRSQDPAFNALLDRAQKELED